MLGRGLESLMPSKQNKDDGTQNNNPTGISVNYATIAKQQGKKLGEGEAIFQIEIEKIEANPHQPRSHFDETALLDLANSIREFGVIQPIVVTKIFKETDNGSDVSYQLIAGERRLRASKLAGLERIPAIIKSAITKRENLEMAIIENLQREDLTPIENAHAFLRLQEEFNLTQKEIAEKLGKSREVIANTVRLLNLPEFIQEAITRGEISESQARLLLSVDDSEAQKSLFEDILKNRLSVRDLREKIESIGPRKLGSARKVSTSTLSPETLDLKEKIESALGAPITIEEKGEGGKLTINFYSKEEIYALAEKLGVTFDDY